MRLAESESGNHMWWSSRMISLFIDADACPVKQEVHRVAERHVLKGTALKVIVISKGPSPPHAVTTGYRPEAIGKYDRGTIAISIGTDACPMRQGVYVRYASIQR